MEEASLLHLWDVVIEIVHKVDFNVVGSNITVMKSECNAKKPALIELVPNL